MADSAQPLPGGLVTGTTPTKCGTISLPDGSAPDATFLTRQWR